MKLMKANSKEFLKSLAWKAANCCMLGGLYTGSLKWDWVRLERLPMFINNLDSDFVGTRLAHLSDLHCGLLVREKHLHNYVEMVNALKVDFVVLTGDFITTASRHHAKTIARIFNDLKPNIATIAVLGNHDYGLWHPNGLGGDNNMGNFITDEMTKAGVIVLRNELKSFFRNESVLQFVGVEDFWSPRYNPTAAFELVDFNFPTISLAHNPDAAPQLASMGADWVLSGHTHGRPTPSTRFWDIVYPVRFKNFIGGQYSLGQGRYLYVNRGIGNAWRIRTEHKPEITLFTLQTVKYHHDKHRSKTQLDYVE